MQLDEVQIHNLGEEHSAGFLNYKLDIRGRQNLEAASHKMVLNKSFDLINQSTESYKKFRKPAAEIKEIKLMWNKKMEEMEYTKVDAKRKLYLDHSQPQLAKRGQKRLQQLIMLLTSV